MALQSASLKSLKDKLEEREILKDKVEEVEGEIKESEEKIKKVVKKKK